MMYGAGGDSKEAKMNMKGNGKHRATEKKPIKKLKYSRLGCLNCKQRRHKCGEELDSCFNCLDKNIRCSYLDLTAAEKQKIIENNKHNSSYHNNYYKSQQQKYHQKRQEFTQQLGHSRGINESFSELGVQLDDVMLQTSTTLDDNRKLFGDAVTVRRNAFLAQELLQPHYEAIGLDNVKTMPSKKIAEENRKNSVFGILDFQKNYSTNTRSTDFTSSDHPINHTKRNLNPLPNHLYNVTTFEVCKFPLLNFSSHYDFDDVLFKVCGEEDLIQAFIRQALTLWLTDTEYAAATSLLIFDAVISRSILLLLVQVQKSYYSRKNERQDIVKVLRKEIVPHQIRGLQLAQLTIERLNQTHLYTKFEYLRLFKNLINYSLMNIGLMLQSESDSTALVAFINGILSTALSIEMLGQFKDASDLELKDQSRLYSEFQLIHWLFPHISDFFLLNIGTLYTPSYEISPLIEFHTELVEFITYAKQHHKVLRHNDVIILQLTDLLRYISTHIINNEKLRNSYDPNCVTTYNMVYALEALNHFFDEYPSECVYIQHTHVSMSTIDKLLYLHWMATACILDNIFPELEYFYTAKFSGGIHWAGYNMDLVNTILQGLEQHFKTEHFSIYDHLYRKTIYLTRLTSFFSHRHRAFVRNLLVTNPYPNNSVFRNQLRLKSRKPKFLQETQMKSFKKGLFKFENYITNIESIPFQRTSDTQYTTSSPAHPNNVCYVDTNCGINENIDENYFQVQKFLQNQYCKEFNLDDFPLEFLKLSDHGVLKNIDFRPNLNNVDLNFLVDKDNTSTDNPRSFKYGKPDMVLREYADDKDEILRFFKQRQYNNL